jgi:histone-lysine N-methyltransferase SUV39H
MVAAAFPQEQPPPLPPSPSSSQQQQQQQYTAVLKRRLRTLFDTMPGETEELTKLREFDKASATASAAAIWEEVKARLTIDLYRFEIALAGREVPCDVEYFRQGNCPVPVYNEVDGALLEAVSVEWIEESRLSADAQLAKGDDDGCGAFLAGCRCGTRCGPPNEACTCARESHDKIFPYGEGGAIQLPPHSCIYECNAACSCGSDCPMRVIQHGPQFRMEIFRTHNGRGWGVRAAEFIPRDRFVCEYVGEIIGPEEAEVRGKRYDDEACSYLFDLDLETKHQQRCFVIDAKPCGNVARYLNHSCDPTLEKYFFWVNHLDKRFPRVAFFSRRNIDPGTELTFDYQYNPKHKRRATKNAKKAAGGGAVIMCRCGSRNCRGVLF